jgi:Zn-dependent protease with chaperone function
MQLAALMPLFLAMSLYLLTLGIGHWLTPRRASTMIKIRYATLLLTAGTLALALFHLHEDMSSSINHMDSLCLPLWLLVAMGLSAGSFTLGFLHQQSSLAKEMSRWSTPASPVLRRTMADLAARLKIRQTPQLRIVTLAQPMAFVVGTIQPTIYLSIWMIEQLTPAELEAVLAHELAHIARSDNLIALISTALLGATAFVPTSWWALRALMKEREFATDALAVSVTGKPITLARGLLKATAPEASSFNAAAGLLEVSMVEERVRHLVELHEAGSSHWQNLIEKRWIWVLTLISPIPLAWIIFDVPHLLNLP